MLADKLRCTDWEATNEAMEEAVARESYLEWLRDREKRARGTRTLVILSSDFFSDFNLSTPCLLYLFIMCILRARKNSCPAIRNKKILLLGKYLFILTCLIDVQGIRPVVCRLN